MPSDWQNWLAGLIVAACLAHLARRVHVAWRGASRDGGCATGCSGCPSAAASERSSELVQIRRP